MLLAFDTATPQVTVALHDGESVVASYESAESMRHGEMLAPGIRRVLADANAKAADVTGIAVGVGPGPFTGLRVGLVTARTLAFVREVEVYGVCTLDILAAAAIDAGYDEFAVATDARRKEVYLASYAGGRRVSGPEVVKPHLRRPKDRWSGEADCSTRRRSRTPVGPEHPSASVLCDVVVNRRFEIVEPNPLYLRRPDAAEPGKPKRVS